MSMMSMVLALFSSAVGVLSCFWFWNIFEIFAWVDANVKAIMEKMLSELRCIITNNKG